MCIIYQTCLFLCVNNAISESSLLAKFVEAYEESHSGFKLCVA